MSNSKGDVFMNRIFKVIWSKTKHCYVVVSEYAKANTKAAHTGLRVTAAAVAAAAMLLAPVNYAWAADGDTVESADTADTTSTALHISSTNNLIVGTKENQIVGDMKIRGKMTSGSISTGDITSSGNVSVTGQVEAGAVYDDTTKTGSYVVQTHTVGANLSALDTQIKALVDKTEAITYDEVSKTVTVAGKLTADSASVTNSISVGHNANVGGAVNAGSLNSRGNLNVDGNALVKGTLTSQSTINGKEIVSQTNITAKNKVVGMQGVVDNTLTSGKYVTAGNTVGENIVALDTQVKANDDAISTEASTREAKDNELNERITNEANAIHETTSQLRTDLNTETAAREASDTALNDQITNVKEYLEKQTSDNYVSKADAAVQDGAIVKAASTIGENVTNLDAALAKETAARIGADVAQDKVIQQVNDNAAAGIKAVNDALTEQVGILNQADANEAAARVAADEALEDNINAKTSARVAADA